MIITTILWMKCSFSNIWPKAHAMMMERIVRMPLAMMLVMMAIFEKTFIRSASPLSKAVRALGRGRH